MESILMAVDAGKHTLKALSNKDKVTFRSKFTKANGSGIDIQGNSYKIKYDGNYYILGDQGEEQNFDVNKANLLHKLSTYTAISKLLNENNLVKLAIGCPVNIFKNRELKQQYKDYIINAKNNNMVNILINDKEYKFVFENALILPEGSGVVYLYPQLFKNKRVAVIDLGGLNMNFTIYDNLVPEISSMFTTNHGSFDLENFIINQLNTRYGINISTPEAHYIINQGGLKVRGKIDNDSIIIVDNIIRNYLNKVIQEIKRNGYNLDVLEIVFVGGTSLLISNKIREIISHAQIIDNAQWTNVEGFYKVGEIKYAQAK